MRTGDFFMTTKELRIKYNKIDNSLGHLYLLLILLGMFMLGFILSGNLIVFLLLILPTIPVFILINRQGKEMKRIYLLLKESIIMEHLNNNFSNIKFNTDEGFSKEFLTDKVYHNYATHSKSYDVLEATCNGVNFKYSYCEVSSRNRNGDHINFSGKVLEVNFHKNIDHYISVTQPKFSHLIDGIDEIKVENIKFDQDFTVYSDNPKSVFYILTPHFMEKIRKINIKHNNSINLHFYESKIVISINDGENFLRIYDVDGDYFNKKIQKNVERLAELINDLGSKNI